MIETLESLSIGERIKRQRVKKSLTQQQLADALGISQGTVAGWERGNSKPNVRVMARLSETLDTSLEYFTAEWDDIVRSDEDAKSYDELSSWLSQYSEDPEGEERSLISLYHTLNGEGKRRVLEFMFDLRQIRRYQSATTIAKNAIEKGG